MTKRMSMAFAAASLLASTACVPRTQMCVASSECGSGKACVVGRCQDPNGASLLQKKEVRRHVIEPVALACVRRGAGSSDGSLPPAVTLGSREAGDARIFLRFAVPLAKDVTILEAYVLMERAPSAQPDPAPIALYAARILDPWDPRSISWGSQPRFEELRTVVTRVLPAPRQVVRVDVREIVQHWPLRDARDQGIVILADNATDVGMAFATAYTTGATAGPSSEPLEREAVLATSAAPPRLELYVK